MKHHSLALSVLLTGTILATSFSAVSFAQGTLDPAFGTIPGVNPGTQASPALQKDPDELNLPEEEQPERQKLNPEKESVEDVDIDVPEPGPTQKLQSARFRVTDIDVSGVTVFEADEIEAIVAEFENKDLTLEELGGLVDQLNQLYRSQGYLTTQAYIPPQDIEGGRVRIEVLEGRIGTISVSGNKFYKTWMLERNIPQEPGDVLNIRDLEDSLNRINQQENFRLKAVLSPGAATGETDIRLELAERQPWQIAGTFDNQGRPFIGRYRYGVEVTSQNFSGIGDKFYARWIGAAGEATNIALAGYTLPITRHGTELSYNFGYSRVQVDLGLTARPSAQPEIEGSAATHQVLLSQPLDKNRTFVADAGFNAKNISSYIDNVRTNRDSIYSFQFGLNFDKVDRWGRTFLRNQFTFAPDFGGHHRQFSKYDMLFTRLVRLPKRNLLILRGNWMYSPHSLPVAEQMQIGGAFSVRGFSEGVLAGDRGWNFGIEDRFPIPGLRALSPYLADRVQGAVFFDYGQVWLDPKNVAFIRGTSNRLDRQLLISAGTGLRARISRYAQGFVDFGFHLVNRRNVEPKGAPRMRVHFGIRSELLPDKVKEHDTGEPEIIKEAYESKDAEKRAKKEAKRNRKAAAKRAKEEAREAKRAAKAAEDAQDETEVFGANAVEEVDNTSTDDAGDGFETVEFDPNNTTVEEPVTPEEVFSTNTSDGAEDDSNIKLDVINLDIEDAPAETPETIPTSNAF